LQAKVATAGVASEGQSEKLAEVSRDRDAIQKAFDEATAQVRCPVRERPARRARERTEREQRERDREKSRAIRCALRAVIFHIRCEKC
jgi:hypothetical protein